MDDLLRVVVLGIVEGLTEFLPVSSTGHLILCERWMGVDLDHDPFWKMFTVVIQVGAILAVVVYFRQRILTLVRAAFTGSDAGSSLLPFPSVPGEGEDRRAGAPMSRISPVWLVLLATVPVLVVGKLAHKWVEAKMETPTVVAMSLGIGGLLMLLIEWSRPKSTTDRLEEMTLSQALLVGVTQVLAVLFPGTSRSAATIMPGMMVGLSRETAAEFSFFLAIPAMFAATGYKLLKERSHMNGRQAMLLVIGTLVSFLVAWIVIAGFMAYIRKRNFNAFAIYRIVLALIVVAAFWRTAH